MFILTFVLLIDEVLDGTTLRTAIIAMETFISGVCEVEVTRMMFSVRDTQKRRPVIVTEVSGSDCDSISVILTVNKHSINDQHKL